MTGVSLDWIVFLVGVFGAGFKLLHFLGASWCWVFIVNCPGFATQPLRAPELTKTFGHWSRSKTRTSRSATVWNSLESERVGLTKLVRELIAFAYPLHIFLCLYMFMIYASLILLRLTWAKQGAKFGLPNIEQTFMSQIERLCELSEVQLLKSVFDEIDFEQVNEISFEARNCVSRIEIGHSLPVYGRKVLHNMSWYDRIHTSWIYPISVCVCVHTCVKLLSATFLWLIGPNRCACDAFCFSSKLMLPQDVKRCLATGELSSFVESMGISTDDVWTGGSGGVNATNLQLVTSEQITVLVWNTEDV